MNKKIIDFYMNAIQLKNVFRTGWIEVGVPKEKVESVADHVYGCMALTLAICCEKELDDLDLIKTFKMLILKELVKIKNDEISVISSIDSKTANRNAIIELTENLSNNYELIALYDEALALETKEAKFALYISKIESDLQAKKYELDGYFTLENALKDIENYPEDIKNDIKSQVQKASDGWILFDRKYYNHDETFETLSHDIQKL